MSEIKKLILTVEVFMTSAEAKLFDKVDTKDIHLGSVTMHEVVPLSKVPEECKHRFYKPEGVSDPKYVKKYTFPTCIIEHKMVPSSLEEVPDWIKSQCGVNNCFDT